MYNAEDRPLDVADFKVEIEENKKELRVISCPENQVPTVFYCTFGVLIKNV
jgi:hypothetical protein